MIETSSVPPRKSSATFGNFRQSSENVRRRSSSLRNNFGKSSKIFGKWSEIFGKSSKTSLLVCLYNKQNNAWTLGDMEFIFPCSQSISHSFAALTRSISMWTLEDKFHISARPFVILYFLQALWCVTEQENQHFVPVSVFCTQSAIDSPHLVRSLWWSVLVKSFLQKIVVRLISN